MKDVKQLSFSEYFRSKQQLLESAEESPRIYSFYSVEKYRKIPLTEDYDSAIKEYIALKPKDQITILWEYENVHFPTARNFIVVEEDGSTKTYYPCWSNKKLLRWVTSNTSEIDHDNAT